MKKEILILSILTLIGCGSEQGGSESFFTNIDKELQACYQSDLKSDKEALKKQCDEKLAEIKKGFSRVSVPSEQCREASVALTMHCALQAKFIHTERSGQELSSKWNQCLFSKTPECQTVNAELNQLLNVGSRVGTCMESRKADLNNVCGK